MLHLGFNGGSVFECFLNNYVGVAFALTVNCSKLDSLSLQLISFNDNKMEPNYG